MLLKLVSIVALAGIMAQEPVLDLTSVAKSDRRFKPTAGSGSGIMGGGSHGAPPTGPLMLSLLTVNNPDENNDIVYEVRFTNNTADTVCIPNDPTISDIEPSKPEQYWYTGGTLDLSVTGAGGNITTVGLVSLFDDANHSHCQRLGAKESMVIRAKAKLASAFNSQPLPGGKLQAKARWTPFSARVWFDHDQIHEENSSTQPITSANAVTVCAKECGL